MVHENGDGTGDLGSITFNVTIAGESWMTNKTFPTLGKYSFTMRNEDGTPRISNLSYSLDGATPIALDYTMEDANSNNGCLLNFFYTANAGTFGGGISHGVPGR